MNGPGLGGQPNVCLSAEQPMPYFIRKCLFGEVDFAAKREMKPWPVPPAPSRPQNFVSMSHIHPCHPERMYPLPSYKNILSEASFQQAGFPNSYVAVVVGALSHVCPSLGRERNGIALPF
ncbi:Hypothetical protein NTJ_04095 [Nesidiocoris tenuis]|uniref:Uncharacterized protein n=1 Tax=Nesidiocoris tenuis TaxID=355587 RepID=A0ABN7AG85_9HEMI|nr:Hypothetical protein NTJ_04095 [Nesidiocoris tenuis]